MSWNREGGLYSSPGSAGYHLLRLEALLTALEDMTAHSGSNARRGIGRRLAAVTGVDAVIGAADDAAMNRALELASRLCNAILASVAGRTHAALAPEIARLRDLIIALADLIEVDLYRSDYPIEREHAFRELVDLLGLSPAGTRLQLLNACFGVGARIATRAIGALQGELQRSGRLSDL